MTELFTEGRFTYCILTATQQDAAHAVLGRAFCTEPTSAALADIRLVRNRLFRKKRKNFDTNLLAKYENTCFWMTSHQARHEDNLTGLAGVH